MKRILILFAVIAVFSACREKSQLEIEVIAIHDEVMPKMGDLHVAKKGLRKMIKSGAHKPIEKDILQLISNLEAADEGMMDWMHNWKVPAEDPEMTAYLKEEKVKITQVKNDMNSSLDEANKFLTKWKKN